MLEGDKGYFEFTLLNFSRINDASEKENIQEHKLIILPFRKLPKGRQMLLWHDARKQE
jgi:hypothetical protein